MQLTQKMLCCFFSRLQSTVVGIRSAPLRVQCSLMCTCFSRPRYSCLRLSKSEGSTLLFNLCTYHRAAMSSSTFRTFTHASAINRAVGELRQILTDFRNSFRCFAPLCIYTHNSRLCSNGPDDIHGETFVVVNDTCR